MPIETKWLLENRIVLVCTSGHVEAADMRNMSDMTIKMFESCEVPLVHILINEQADSLPKSVGHITKATEFMRHEKMGWFIIFGNDNPVMKFQSYLVSKVMRLRYRRVNTMQEALEFLQMVDSTLLQALTQLDGN